jgi:hypothetical protein
MRINNDLFIGAKIIFSMGDRIITESKGTIRYYRDFRLHRDNDLPAIEWGDDGKEWYKNGMLHRDNDLPAIEWSDGGKGWYQNNKKIGVYWLIN